ncbi:MAG: putative rane-located cobalamin biosynthesis protein, partial [Pseudonocardiales bacterium]|nr:putative rane-located cobalamin biosynthesis protein [Pseudonocardiales bacterium]
MHIPDGFINAPTSVAAAGVAVAGVAVCLRGARRELDERTAPMAGLVAAFVFALQMLNFPVAAGTSGHLLGGTLAAILVGPYTGALCVAVVLLVQGFLFADGGLSALGLNITIMAFTTATVGWAVHKLVLALMPKRDSSLPPAAFVGALVSVPTAAVVFCGFYAVGGETRVPFATVFGAMVGVHLLIGIGEALITAVVVSAVLATRRDLVFAARRLQSPAAAARAAGS